MTGRGWTLRRLMPRLLLSLLAVTAALLLVPPSRAAAPRPAACQPPALRWGGDCWTAREGGAFARWLRAHGAQPARWARRHPQLAVLFGPGWPPAPFWRRCTGGYRCALAVLPRFFDSWRYALQIVRCETGETFSARALGAAGERGWFQIHPVHFGSLDETRLWDPRYNTRAAYRISGGGTDWTPWTCARYM